jgi:hypothetical protein
VCVSACVCVCLCVCLRVSVCVCVHMSCALGICKLAQINPSFRYNMSARYVAITRAKGASADQMLEFCLSFCLDALK